MCDVESGIFLLWQVSHLPLFWPLLPEHAGTTALSAYDDAMTLLQTEP